MAIADWLQFTQSIFSSLFFSFFLAKLFSLIFASHDDHDNTPHANPNHNSNEHTHDVIKTAHDEEEEKEEEKEEEGEKEEEEERFDTEITNKLLTDEPNKVVAAMTDTDNDSDSDNDDDWEGVETTELDEAFSAANAFMGSKKVSSDLKFELYGLCKIATQGACCVPKPSPIKMTARAKWNAWHKLGAMPPEEAMQKYLDIISTLYPTWADGSTSKRGSEDFNEPSSKDTRPMGPVFGSFIHEEETGNELKVDVIHHFKREGDIANLQKCVEGSASVDTKDSEGQTPLHWSVDRGNIDVTELLLSRNADLNVKDNEGQTPKHYDAVCDREAIAELLVKKNAGKDDDWNLPSDQRDSNWPLI